MALTLYWGSGSPFSWRVLLALEHKRLPYESQLLHFDKQEHQSPQMLKLNPRGRVPVLKDGDYVVFESVAVLYYLDVKYPQPPIFGATPEEAGVIMRVICEFQAYAEPSLLKIVSAIFADRVADDIDELTDAMHVVGARSAHHRRALEQGGLDRRGQLFRHRHGDLPVDTAACGAPWTRVPRPNSARASCRWKETIRRWRAGSRASKRFPATSEPTRLIGARTDGPGG